MKDKTKLFIIIVIALSFITSISAQDRPIHDPKFEYDDGSAIPHSDLKINTSINKKEVYRCDDVIINYNITSCGVKKIHIKTRKYFENAKITYSSKKRKSDYINEKGEIVVDLGDLNRYTYNNLSYKAKVKKDCTISPDGVIKLDENMISWYDKIAVMPSINSINLYVYNNKPHVNLSHKRAIELLNSSHKMFKGELINLVLETDDAEDISLKYTLKDNYSLINEGIINNSISKDKIIIPYVTNNTTKIEVLVQDKDSGVTKKELLLSVNDYTYEELKANQTILRLLIIVFISFVGLSFRNFFDFKRISILIILISIWVFLLILSIYVEYLVFFREVANFEVGLYFVTFIIAAYFIEANFLNKQMNDQTNKKRLSRVIINNITETDQPDWRLWVISSLSMFIIMIFLILCIPKSNLFMNQETILSDKYNYIFWYFSMLPQTFGAILAVVVAFTGWYLAEKTLTNGERKEFKSKIRHFIILYVSIIILSVFGLVNSTIPPLNKLFLIISNPSEAIAIITIESTLLLMIPAFACLYELAKWTMELND